MGKTESQMEDKVLEWQKQLSNYDSSKDADETLLILQDAEIDSTVKTVVQVLSAATENENLPMVQASLDILSVVALQETGKTLFVSGGVLKRITELLRKSCLSQKFLVSSTSTPTSIATSTATHDEKKDEETVSNEYDNSRYLIPATALHCLANLSEEASDAIKHDYLLPIANPLILNLMDQYLPAASIQRYACKLIYHLSNPLLQELVAAGSVSLLWRAHQAHPDDGPLQHYANASLYNLLPVCPQNSLKQFVHPQQLVQGLVPGMTANPTVLEVQTYGLLVMTRVASTYPTATSSPSPKNSLVARFSQLKASSQDKDLEASHALGLDHVICAILSAMNLHCTDQQLAQIGCNLVKTASKQSTEFCTSMIHHGGLRVLVQIIQTHLDHTSIQDPAMACVRNLLSLRSSNTANKGEEATTSAARAIRKELLVDAPKDQEGDDLANTIRAIGLVMTIHAQDAPIQAYGCDVLGRLAAVDDFAKDGEENKFWVRESLYEGNAIRLALQSMREHPQHVGVQDRAIVLLLRLCSYELAYDFMRQPQEGPVESEDDDEEIFVVTDGDDGSIDMPSTPPRANEPEQSFLYQMLQETRVAPKKDSQDRLQRLLSIVDVLRDKELLNDEEGHGSSLLSKLSVESASERMKSFRDSFSSPAMKSPRDWASPLKEKWASRSWQSPPSS